MYFSHPVINIRIIPQMIFYGCMKGWLDSLIAIFKKYPEFLMQTLLIHFRVTCQSGDLPEEGGF